MFTNNMLAVSGALFSLVAAVPMAKRDIVWVTETALDIVTIPVTTTVWVEPGQTAPAVAAEESPFHFGHGHHGHSKITSTIHSTATVTMSASSSPSVAPVESSSSVYVAPTTSSTSVYVAPTTSSTSVYVAPTTSSTSVYVAPTTSSTSVYVAPTTSSTSVYVAPTTSSISVAPTTTASPTTNAASTASSVPATATTVVSSGPGAAGTSYTGDLTWYQDGLGACGQTNGPDDAIVAISHIIFDSYPDGGNPNNNPMCGQTVSITGADGSVYEAVVVDRCTGCAEGDLDLSEDYFNSVTNYGNGRVPGMTWHFN